MISSDLSLLHPVFRAAVQATLAELALDPVPAPFRLFEGYRSPERQAHLYAQGRTDRGTVVTHAKPWESYHQYGLGADFVLWVGGTWSWSTTTQQHVKWWGRLRDVGIKHGLEGLNFEAPHLQLKGLSSKNLRAGILPDGGDDAWRENIDAALARCPR